MDIGTLDLSDLTWQQFAVAALAVTLVRWAVAVVAAIKPPSTFTVADALAVFHDHVLSVVTPIAAVAFVALSLPPGSPAHAALWALACGGLALYIVDTVKSAAENWATGTPTARSRASA